MASTTLVLWTFFVSLTASVVTARFGPFSQDNVVTVSVTYDSTAKEYNIVQKSSVVHPYVAYAQFTDSRADYG